MRKIICYLLLVVLCLASCTMNEQANIPAYDTLVDDYNRTVVVPTSPQRIISTSPAITEIIFSLGGEDLLKGRTDYCTYPPQAAEIPSIGGISNLNVEHVLSLKPDLIISGSMVPEKYVSQLEKMGVPIVCIPEKDSFEGLYDNIKKVGHLLRKESVADSLNKAIASQVNAITHISADPKTVYYVVGFGASGNYTAGGNTFINDIIRFAGGRNIAENIEGWSYSLETLMAEDPDFILIRAEDSSTFCNTAPYTRLSAVKNGRVVAIESGMIDIQVPRNLQAIELIHKRLSE